MFKIVQDEILPSVACHVRLEAFASYKNDK